MLLIKFVSTSKNLFQMPNEQIVNSDQTSAFESPWSSGNAPCAHFGNFAGSCFVSGPQSRSILGGFFGCGYLRPRSRGHLLVHSRARIAIPSNLTLRDRACLGDRANAYSLGEIEIGEHATIAQEGYLSTGSHDFSQSSIPLTAAKITIGPDAFIGARAFVLPGVTIGERSVIGACSVVTENVPPAVFAAGNPCRVLRPR